MVSVPVVMTLATPEPEIMPNRPELITAARPGPPVLAPVSRYAVLMMTAPNPVFSRNAPRMTKITINVAKTFVIRPNMPSVEAIRKSITSSAW